MAETPTSDREKVPACVDVHGRQRYWIEIEVQDDPRNPQSKIFIFRDVSEIHDLRRQIDDKAQFHDLVGHTRSSFTGGVSDHQGVLKAAEGGTWLLDEIGDIPLDIQGSVLQEREVTRLGENTPRKVNVRIIAALEYSQGNRTAAARLLGISRATFYRRLTRPDIGIN